MDNKNSSTALFFEHLHSLGVTFENEKQIRLNEKSQILEKANHDIELEQWYKREESFSFPLSRGETIALQDWNSYCELSKNYFECDDLPWEKDLFEYVKTLRNAGINEFVITDHSTALMESLHLITSYDCKLISLATVTREEKRWGSPEKSTILGILFKL